MNRMQNTNIVYLRQAIVAYWVLSLVSVGFITTLLLLHVHDSAGSRRPGFNLKEI